MQISVRALSIGTIVVFLSGAAISYRIVKNTTPEKIVTKTEVVEKIVLKETESKKTSAKTKVNRTTTIEKKSDGSEVTVIVDKSVEEEKEESVKDVDKIANTKEKSDTTQTSQRMWRVGAKTDFNMKDYEASAGYRVFGNVWAETSYNSRVKKPMVGISVEF